jgi:N-acetylglucosaminyldiphosphoundecaprenol N-acetyl-beta-D-mannosaminyltransferase
MSWAAARQSRSVCYSNAHMLIEAKDDPGFARLLHDADLVLPDGRPLAWMLRILGSRGQQQLRGPDGMRLLLAHAAEAGMPVGFYGSTDEVLAGIMARVCREHPRLDIAYVHSPPYRELTPPEDSEVVERINASGARLLFVGLGCPKQERWMAQHRGRVQSVMLGVGAAFDLYSGRIAESPPWISRLGLEWAYRFAREPRRLLARNLVAHPRFAIEALMQLVAGSGTGKA